MRKIVFLLFLLYNMLLYAENIHTTTDIEPVQTVTKENTALLTKIENWYADNMNYMSIVALMAIESSFIPFPSEVVIPPAAYVASNPDSLLNVTNSYPLNVLFIIICGTLGALIGALINYLLAMWLGRPLVYAFVDSRVGHLLLLSSQKLQKAEDYFNRHGKISTLIGRLIPAVRQLISIPAGLAKMNLGSFIAFTTLGALIWNTILAMLGYVAHGQADLITKYSHELSLIFVLLLIAAIMIFAVIHLFKKRKVTK